MNLSPSILCPIDFSDASAVALRHAAAIAAHFASRLIVLSVEDPLLTEAVDLGTGVVWDRETSMAQMAQFTAQTFGPDSSVLATLEYEVAVGKPAPEILRVAREKACDLIVISTHGLTGFRKLFFGSTTERVLRETACPVLVTPPVESGSVRLEDAKRLIGRLLVPVDLSPASHFQVQVASGLAAALGLPLIMLHVIEPMRSHVMAHAASIESNRRAVAEEGLAALSATLPAAINRELLVVYGDPAEELAKVVRDRRTGLTVMGLHGSPLLGPRMGSVTYRLLCLSRTLVLALPPKLHAAVEREPATSAAVFGGGAF